MKGSMLFWLKDVGCDMWLVYTPEKRRVDNIFKDYYRIFLKTAKSTSHVFIFIFKIVLNILYDLGKWNPYVSFITYQRRTKEFVSEGEGYNFKL